LSETFFEKTSPIYRVDHFNQYTRISRKGEVFSKNVIIYIYIRTHTHIYIYIAIVLASNGQSSLGTFNAS